MKDLLIVEDDPTLGEGIRLALQAPELRPQLCRSLADAGELLSRRSFDLLILDLNLPGMDGLDLLRAVRAEHPELRVLILSARAELSDRVAGLDLGADDYITKPFGVMELISRVKAMLRRSQKSQEKDKVLKLGNIVLDREKHSVTVGKEPVELTYKEYELLKLLMTNAGIVTTRELILDRVWGIDFEGESRTLSDQDRA